MITAYKIVTGTMDYSTGRHPIEEAVNRAIQDGWIPLGGVCETDTPSNPRHYAQAMVREEK